MTIPQTTYGATMAIGIAGQLVGAGPHEIIPAYNDEASAEIPFGYGVKYGATATDNYGMLLPAAEADTIVGIVVHSHEYSKGFTGAALGDTGVRAGFPLSILRKGRILVVCEDAVTRGDRLWVRCTTGGAGEIIGGLNNADEGTETVDCTGKGVWMTSAAAGGLAELEVDFTNEV